MIRHTAAQKSPLAITHGADAPEIHRRQGRLSRGHRRGDQIPRAEEERADRYPERTIILSEQPDSDELAVMHDIPEKAPVTLLIKFPFGVGTTFIPSP